MRASIELNKAVADRTKAEGSLKTERSRAGGRSCRGFRREVFWDLYSFIYFNDLDQAARQIEIVKKFADDTKMGQELWSMEEREKLQQAIDGMLE
jgi:hypothetical protein